MTNKTLSCQVSCKNLVSIILTIILFHFTLNSSAAKITIQDLNTRITLNVNRMPVTEVLKKINHKVKIDFAYGSDVLTDNKTVSLNVKEEKLSVVLNMILQPLSMRYSFSDDLILIEANNDDHNGQEVTYTQNRQIQVRGTVTDNKGIPLPGVSVKLKGGTAGASTNADGKYAISLPDGNGTLVYTFMGYVPQEIALNGRTAIDVVMKEQSQNLSEVVVTALGVKREKRSLAYAVTEVGGEQFRQGKIMWQMLLRVK